MHVPTSRRVAPLRAAPASPAHRATPRPAWRPARPHLPTRHAARTLGATAASAPAASPSRPPRLIQDKDAAKWFYAFLAQVYDKIVNPGHWTVDMVSLGWREGIEERRRTSVRSQIKRSPLPHPLP